MLKTKYKERSPMDTVSIVGNFFKSIECPNGKAFKIVELDSQNNEGFWWHKYALYYEDLLIVTSYGKGETEEYSKASAYAELYERFAWCDNMLENEDKDFFPEEIPLNKMQLAKPFPQVKSKNIDAWYAVLLNRYGKVAGVPFKNVWGDDEMLIDLNAKAEADGSNGIAAGNTLTEALNQGLSELLERYVQNICYYDNLELKRIDESLIEKEAPQILEKIKRLENKGIDIKIYDTSFSTGLPVLCSVVTDKNTFHHRFCFGAFPVFNIALERTLTEVFQGQTPKRHDFIPAGIHRNPDLDKIRNNRIDFPRKQFIKAETTIETGSFIDASVTNDEIFIYLKTLFKEKGFDAYYRDLSLCEDIKTVYIHSPQLEEHVSFEIFCDGEVIDRTEKMMSIIKEESLTRADLRKFVEILDSLNMVESRSLCQLFYRSPVEPDYIKGVCNTLLYMHLDAAESFADLVSTGKYVYLKIYTKLRAENATNKAIKEELIFWGAPEELVNAFMKMDFNKLIEIYLYDIVRSLEGTRLALKEVRNIIRKLRR